VDPLLAIADRFAESKLYNYFKITLTLIFTIHGSSGIGNLVEERLLPRIGKREDAMLLAYCLIIKHYFVTISCVHSPSPETLIASKMKKLDLSPPDNDFDLTVLERLIGRVLPSPLQQTNSTNTFLTQFLLHLIRIYHCEYVAMEAVHVLQQWMNRIEDRNLLESVFLDAVSFAPRDDFPSQLMRKVCLLLYTAFCPNKLSLQLAFNLHCV
jgi:hypothetical protein